MIRVAIAGAAGRMGRTLIDAVNQSSENLTITAASVLHDDPALGLISKIKGSSHESLCPIPAIDHA